ncbi:MAG: hypothetical protein HFJ52_00060 [Clostridia bacterium]|nr:hypothetical protein [Clostridia bacterium]
MKNAEKKRLYILIGAVALIIVLIIAFTGKKDKNPVADTNINSGEETKVMTTQKMAEVKQYSGFEISNVQFKVENNMIVIEANVKNNTGVDKKGEVININVLDKEGNKITSVGGYIDPVKAGESTPIYSTILANGAENKVYDIEITEKREENTTNTNTATQNTAN